jgi:hypothetical protein
MGLYLIDRIFHSSATHSDSVNQPNTPPAKRSKLAVPLPVPTQGPGSKKLWHVKKNKKVQAVVVENDDNDDEDDFMFDIDDVDNAEDAFAYPSKCKGGASAKGTGYAGNVAEDVSHVKSACPQQLTYIDVGPACRSKGTESSGCGHGGGAGAGSALPAIFSSKRRTMCIGPYDPSHRSGSSEATQYLCQRSPEERVISGYVNSERSLPGIVQLAQSRSQGRSVHGCFTHA